MAIKQRPANRIQRLDDTVDGWLKHNVNWAWRLNHWLLNRRDNPNFGKQIIVATTIMWILAIAVIALGYLNQV